VILSEYKLIIPGASGPRKRGVIPLVLYRFFTAFGITLGITALHITALPHYRATQKILLAFPGGRKYNYPILNSGRAKCVEQAGSYRLRAVAFVGRFCLKNPPQIGLWQCVFLPAKPET
jgi:hypothetical protein